MKNSKTIITVTAIVNSSVSKVWKTWTLPDHIINWNNASPDWCTPRTENDLRPEGRFKYRMEAKDGSFGFDFGGKYDVVKVNGYIEYTLDDDRKVKITFSPEGSETLVTEVFETEPINSVDLQKQGWQAILDNFKNYTEGI